MTATLVEDTAVSAVSQIPILNPEAHVARTSWPHVVLGVIGMAISAFAVHIHHLAKIGADTGCGFSETINCEVVMSSKWGELFGVPLGFYGILYFAVVVVLAIATKSSRTTVLQSALQILALAALGFFSSVALTYISVVYIGAECPVCLSIHTVNLLLFIVSIVGYLRARSRLKALSSGVAVVSTL